MPTPFLLLQDFGMAHRSAAGDATLLAGVDLEVPAGRFYLLLGHSGGGKSSLLRLCTGLLDPREVGPQLHGRIECLGESLAGPFPPALRGRVLAILQDEGLLDELSPRQNVELALVAAGRSRKLAPALLAQVGLDPVPEHTAALSGGMRKRLAVARALATQPAVLWCDEPTAGLDPAAARQVAMLLREAHTAAADRTTVVITHDREAFEGLVDAILLLDRNTQQLRVLAKDEPVSTGMPSPASAALPPSSLHALRGRLLGLSAVGETLLTSLVRLPPAHPGMMVREVARQCLEPLLFVGTVGAVIGGLATFFALRNNPIEGAFEAQVLTGTGKVLTAVLIPLLAGLFFCARIAAGASARIGTMQRTQQVSALTMMGVNPADFLLTPLVWAMVIALPVSTAVACLAAAAASWLAATAVSNIATESWAAWFYATVDLRDVRGVLGGAALTGYLVALATWHLSIAQKRSGRDVGNAVNASIVTGMTLVLAVHAVLTFGRYA